MIEQGLSRRQWLAGAAAAGLAGPRAAWGQAPFVATPNTVIAAMLDLAGLRPGERLIDLGCGDGRIVLEAARRGADARGVDRDPALIERARRRAALEGLDTARFETGDLFEANVRGSDVVTLYLLSAMNARLRPKLLFELAPGARIVSHAFDMGDWAPDAMRVADDKNIFLWVVPAVAGGDWQLTRADGEVGRLSFDQRLQRLDGSFGAVPLTGVALRGARLSFRIGGLAFAGLVGDRSITPDPDAAPTAEQGWRADRIG